MYFIFSTRIRIQFGLIFFLGLASCHSSNHKELFISIPSDFTGIHFSNNLIENDTLNILNNEYIYNGGGVAIGDLNGDGKPDIFFTGNLVSNKLYLNQGKMKFLDITQKSGLEKSRTWSTGVSLLDINQDGKLDILVCNSIYKDSTRLGTYLYINQGNDKNGIPHFKEMAQEYGLNDKGHNVQAALIDFNHDGNLDLVFITNIIQFYPNEYKTKTHDGTSPTVDKLYRNDWDPKLGHPVFHDISKKAGIVEEGYSHAVSIADFNGDGWDDIYITNDYLSNDILYINNHDGTFTNRIDEYFKHQSHSAMGNDVADINHDGLPDIFTTEMLPNDNKRKKLMLGGNNYQKLILDSIYHFQRQYIRNTLQLNEGPASDKSDEPVFSEIGQLSGVHQTDWSWCPLFADFDNDGNKDIYVTNGFPRDVTDHDYASFHSSYSFIVSSKKETLSRIPRVKIPNFMFRNEGNLSFSDSTQEWGLKIPSFSNGAAYADLDGDGDLDLVVNNIDSSAFIFKNQFHELGLDKKNHFVRIELKGEIQNILGIGAKIYLYPHGSPLQFSEQTLNHGYISTSEPILHFGLGKTNLIDSIRIIWPVSHTHEASTELLKNISVNQKIIIDQKNALPFNGNYKPFPAKPSLLRESSAKRNIHFTHHQNDFIDFNIEPTLPHKYSQYGPGIAVGDINGDGLDDFFVGGEMGYNSYVFYQQNNGSFKQVPFSGSLPKNPEDDLGALFFDADGDGDLDLYIASGGFERKRQSSIYIDRLYINDGKGNFTLVQNAIPQNRDSKLCVRVGDYDGDGKPDILVCTRVVPGSYPQPGPSYILHNDTKEKDHPHFTDQSSILCPELKTAGMISDALWTDFNNDGKLDFILCPEFGPIQFYEQKNGKFINISAQSGVNSKHGWWNSIIGGDFDNDGDIDYIVGNLGLNTPFQGSDKRPVEIYAYDFDHNGTLDPIISTYIIDSTGQYKPYPYHSRDDIFRQVLALKKKFLKYGDYGKAQIQDLFPDSIMKKALHYSANYFYSSYLENKGNGHFELHPLPMQAQFGPVFGMQAYDLNQDGNLDILISGNDYGCELLGGDQDALQGLVLKGDGKGGFSALKLREGGLYIPGDGRALSRLVDGKGKSIFLASQNKGPLKCFEETNNPAENKNLIHLKTDDQYALIQSKSGITRKVEFYYGSGFISQSSRVLTYPRDTEHIQIFNSKNQKRDIF